MPVESFKFVSPGVFVNEIDNSQIPATPVGVGPTIIGRFQKGPAMRPVRVGSFSEFIDIFGAPVAGKGSGDIWRVGNTVGPTYAAYAAQAWLRNSPSVNVIRLLGTQTTNPEANSDGFAGWQTANLQASASDANHGGAYGLFLFNSGSTAAATNNLGTGVLAAIWYIDQGSMALSGTRAGSGGAIASATTTGSNLLLQSEGENGEFKAIVYKNDGSTHYSTTFNFNKNSNKYIRTVFNTNPILTNSTITNTANQKYYWLGETYERFVDDYITLTGSGQVYGFIVPLASGSSYGAKHRQGMQAAKTGWVIGQDLSTDHTAYAPGNMPKLFRVSSLDSGEWEQRNLKISVYDVKGPKNNFVKYGTFSLAVRAANDFDANPVYLERFTNLNLNPASENYIAKRIGDKYIQWSDSERRYKEYGNYSNVSKYIYVEMDAEVDSGYADPQLVPFGFFGPPRFKSFTANGNTTTPATSFVSPTAVRTKATGGKLVDFGTLNATASFIFPTVALRANAGTDGLSDKTKAFFGVDFSEKNAKAVIDESFIDVLRAPPSDYANYVASEVNREASFVFSLDDLVSDATNGAVYTSGSRAANTSITAISSSYEQVLNLNYNRFTMPLFGGFDALNVKEAEPFRNSGLTNAAATPTEKNNYVYNTLVRAIDTVADPESVVTDIISIPGVTYSPVTKKLIDTCEQRGDALAIVDLPYTYTPESESTATAPNRLGDVDQAISDLKSRTINSSYAAAYFPWVQVRDTISNQNIWVPPSVVALGALSYGQSSQELWFAPAGFTRGGLSEGRGGLPVLSVSQRLTSQERDNLYEANINPIAQFPAEGIVIFGQKTLQVTPSALDRINVRRLMIFLKRQISFIASTLLFDQNVDVTWARFKGQTDDFLSSVKSRLGLVDYKVILDSSTTTPDLVDRNILYAKILLKPAKAIEFIAIDFVVTNQGASFND